MHMVTLFMQLFTMTVLDTFNDFYNRRLKPSFDSNDIWNEMKCI